MLRLESVSVGYGPIEVLHAVSLHIEQGEIITLIGANGAGKSTTLKTISGLLRPSRGRILLHGAAIHGHSPETIVGRGISQVPEGRRIFAELSVRENLELGAFLRRDRDGIAEDFEYVFGLFPILKERQHQAGGTLSGGEQQMLAISRALMARPSLLLLDEPSLGLAPLVISRIFDIIQRINRQHGTTIFLVEQNANLALQVAHRGYVMENGTITLHDRAAALLANDKVREAYLGI